MRSGETVTKPAPAPAGHEAVRAASTPLAAVLAWVIPGAGHWYLGLRERALVFFVVIVVTFWGGVAMGGVRTTVNIQENGPWFAAQLCAGGQSLAALMWSRRIADRLEHRAIYPTSDIAVIYTSIAGLLNLLVIVDALARAEARGAPASRPRSPPEGGP